MGENLTTYESMVCPGCEYEGDEWELGHGMAHLRMCPICRQVFTLHEILDAGLAKEGT